MVLGWADSASSEILLGMQYLRSIPYLQNQFLYFEMSPVIYIHIQNWKNTGNVMGPNFLSLDQQFSTGGDFAPQGSSVNVGGISDCHNWEVLLASIE